MDNAIVKKSWLFIFNHKYIVAFHDNQFIKIEMTGHEARERKRRIEETPWLYGGTISLYMYYEHMAIYAIAEMDRMNG